MLATERTGEYPQHGRTWHHTRDPDRANGVALVRNWAGGRDRRWYDLTDPVLWRIAQIVHEADLYDAPEAAGPDTALRGLSLVGTDEQTLTVSSAVFDGLYEFYRRSLLLGREPA